MKDILFRVMIILVACRLYSNGYILSETATQEPNQLSRQSARLLIVWSWVRSPHSVVFFCLYMTSTPTPIQLRKVMTIVININTLKILNRSIDFLLFFLLFTVCMFMFWQSFQSLLHIISILILTTFYFVHYYSLSIIDYFEVQK